MHKRTKALAIPREVRRRVSERDGGRCILCGMPGNPEAHYLPRAQGGLGIEENILTLCRRCHRAYDGEKRKELRPVLREYLREQYPGWDEISLIYQKWRDTNV